MSDMILFCIWSFAMLLWGVKIGFKMSNETEQEDDNYEW
jgi:hypothetical protein